MKTTLSRQHKMTRAIPAKKVNLVPSSFPIRMRRDQVEVWGSEIEFLTNFYWLLENIESLDRMLSFNARSETHLKVPVNSLQINMHCWFCIAFIANNTINLLHRNANRTHHVEAQKWGIYHIHWHASTLLLNNFIIFKTECSRHQQSVFQRGSLFINTIKYKLHRKIK